MERIRVRAEKALSDELAAMGCQVEPPLFDYGRDAAHGHISSPAALKMAKRLRRPPLEAAERVGARLREVLGDDVERVEVARPGFVNVFPSAQYYHRLLRHIRDQGSAYGRWAVGGSEAVQVEFCSANPTGPLTVAHGRQAAVGDVLASILEAVGYAVTREYFINDSGGQIRRLGESIYSRYAKLFGKDVPLPEGGYQGDYLIGVAEDIARKYGDKFLAATGEDIDRLTALGVEAMLVLIRKDLEDFGVRFDSWTSQLELEKSSLVDAVVADLKARGLCYERDRAVWLKTAEFGDSEDRVLVKSDGTYAYRAPDIAYHKRKFDLGFKRVIDLWGPDHHAHVITMKAALRAIGLDPSAFHVLIVQHCTLFRGGAEVKMSKRAGDFITLAEVVEEVGKDNVRYFFVMRRTDSHLDFDLEVAKAQSLDNPVYYVQYAHARIRSIQKKAVEERGYRREELTSESVDLAPLDARDLELASILDKYPDVVLGSAQTLEPHRITDYLEELARAFHNWYGQCQVLSDERSLSLARLYLIECIRIVIANGLTLLGVSAPSEM